MSRRAQCITLVVNQASKEHIMDSPFSYRRHRRIVGVLATGLVALSLTGSAQAQEFDTLNVNSGPGVVFGPVNLGGCVTGIKIGSYLTPKANLKGYDASAICYVVR
jgi:hypothetical protein